MSQAYIIGYKKLNSDESVFTNWEPLVMHNSLSQETEGWVGQFCSGQGWVSLRRGLPIKVQIQGILWSWEDRGNALFTFLGGGASRWGADSRGRGKAGHKDEQSL